MSESTPPPSVIPDILPWENPGLPFGARWSETLKLFVTRPQEAFRRMPVHAEFLMPLLFAVLMGFAGSLATFAWEQVVPSDRIFAPNEPSPEEMENVPEWMQGAQDWGKSPILLILSPVLTVAVCFINSLIIHFFLMLFKGAQSTYWGTYRTVCYALGTASVAALVPVCGGILQMIWGIVLIILGLQIVHRTTSGKAVFAVIVPMLLMCACFGAITATLMIPFMDK